MRHSMGMPSAFLARHRAATGAVLTAIADTLTHPRSDGDTWAAVLAHPATPEPVVTELAARLDATSTWTPDLACAAATRENPPPRVLQHLLDDADRATWVHHLSQATTGQLHTLARLAADLPAARHTLAPAVIDAPATTPGVRACLATALAADPQPRPAVRTWIMSLVERTAPATTHQLVRRVRASTTAWDVLQDLDGAQERASDRRAVTGLLLAGASTTPAAWASAVRSHAHTDPDIADRALRSRLPADVLQLLVVDTRLPRRTRRAAYLQLRAHPDKPPLPVDLHELYTGARLPTLRQLLVGARPAEISFLLSDPDFPAGVIGVLWRTTSQTIRHDPHALAAFTTHPRTPPPVRAAAAAHLAGHHPSPLASIGATVTAVLHDHPGPAGAVHLPAAYLTAKVPVQVHQLIEPALGNLLGQVTNLEEATCLLRLYGQFSGTIAELFDTAKTLAT